MFWRKLRSKKKKEQVIMRCAAFLNLLFMFFPLTFISFFYSFPENKLRWKADDTYGTAFAQDIVLINGTHMEINQEGYYFIYTATTFDHSGQDTVATLYQRLVKFHPMLPITGDVELIFSKFGGSRESDRHHTNFLAGVFKLTPKYRISSSLSLNAHRFLDKSSFIKNYIGIYKL
jgi:hypothetical protein